MSRAKTVPAASGPILVVGADGLIGSALLEHLQQAGKPVWGTTRRPGPPQLDRVHLDLSQPAASWPQLPAARAVVLCAGVTSMERCRKDPERTRAVNVEALWALSQRQLACGAQVILLSSSQVFHGSLPYPAESTPVSPQTEYGRQKAELEQRLLSAGDRATVIRLSKVLGPRVTLFETWAEALRRREAIHPFSDMVMAPAPLETVVEMTAEVIERQLTGILHLSGASDLSYAAAAITGGRLLEADEQLVQPITGRQHNLEPGALPVYAALSCDRISRETSFSAPDPAACVERAWRTALEQMDGRARAA